MPGGLPRAGLRAWLIAACGCLPLAGVAQTAPARHSLVIRNVTVVDTHDGTLHPGRAVVIEAGRILRIEAEAEATAAPPIGASSVDGSGKFLVPGLLDMHTHALPLLMQGQSPWPMLLAHGVTGIREMAGSLTLTRLARQINVERAAGLALAPEILQVPGEIVFGVTSAALARRMVLEQKAMGADFIKVVSADRDAALAIVDAARQHGLQVAGHLPPSLPTLEAIQAGWHAIEHLGAGIGMLLDCARDASAIRRAIADGQGASPGLNPLAIVSPLLFRAADAPLVQRVIDSHDEGRCEALAAASARGGTWHVPTLIRLRTMAFSTDETYHRQADLDSVDKTRRALWEQLARQYAHSVPPAAAATFRRYYTLQQRLAQVLQQQGVRLMAGSDLGGIWLLPGASLHQELIELEAAGLTPLQVLQAATLNGALFLQREATMGSVDEGKQADLLLLDANPLLSAANLGRIDAVIMQGVYHPRSELDAWRRARRRSVAATPLRDVATVLDRAHVHR